MWRLISWIYRERIFALKSYHYDRGWRDGVDQERVDPNSTTHHVTDEEWY